MWSDTCEVKMNVIAFTRVSVPYFVAYTKTRVRVPYFVVYTKTIVLLKLVA